MTLQCSCTHQAETINKDKHTVTSNCLQLIPYFNIRMQYLHVATFMAALATIAISGRCARLDSCDGEEVCVNTFKAVEKALLADETNLARMRKAFFYSPTATPVLLKVIYNVTYVKNATTTSAVDSNQLTKCSSSNESSSAQLNQGTFVYGWTSSGAYTVFHPIVLSMMQAHTPFAILRLIHKALDQRSPEADAFLWDGSYELPTLYLNVHLSSLPCTPSKDMFKSVLMDITKLVSTHARHIISL